MYTASMYSRMDQMFALTILMLVAGGIIEFAFGKLRLVTDRWSGGKKGGRT